VLTSLRARCVFPVDRPPIEHGIVTFEDERIVAVGTEPLGRREDVQDLGAMALLPGLVNAHTHLEFSDLPRPLGTPCMSLTEWIRLVIAERGQRRTDALGAIGAGLRESLQHGVTTIGEITTTNTLAAYADADATLFLEVIGFSRARASSALAAVVARLGEFNGADNVVLGLSPHAPYTVSPDLLQQLIVVASERNLPVAMHLAESVDEIELLNRGSGAFQELLEERSMWDAEAIPPRTRPLDYLRRLTEAPRSLVIHGNYLDHDERKFLADNRDRTSLIYCPRTHGYFAHPPYPLAELLAWGVNVALGTDSRASNPDLDLLAELRYAARTHSSIHPHEILYLGTLAGAIALGRDSDVGSLTPGKYANMIAIPVDDNSRTSAADSLAELLTNECRPAVVWFKGKKLQ
jgi:cytosine/adenosine deaminase-related metal-dependent hydrolase